MARRAAFGDLWRDEDHNLSAAQNQTLSREIDVAAACRMRSCGPPLVPAEMPPSRETPTTSPQVEEWTQRESQWRTRSGTSREQPSRAVPMIDPLHRRVPLRRAGACGSCRRGSSSRCSCSSFLTCRARRPRASPIRSSCPKSPPATSARRRSIPAAPSPARSKGATTTRARSRRPSATPSWRRR